VLNERRVAGHVFFKNGQTPRDLRRRVSMIVAVIVFFFFFVLLIVVYVVKTGNSRAELPIKGLQFQNTT